MGPQETNADPVEVARLAKEVLETAAGFASSATELLLGLTVSQASFGNSSAAPGVHGRFSSSSEGTELLVGRVIEILEGDSDRLYRVAAAYQRADQDAAARACAARSTSPYPC